MQNDLDNRSSAITWPANYDPVKARLFSHNDLTIDAPCQTIFHKLTDAESWPSWLVFAKDVQTPGHQPLKKNVVFSWSIFGKPIESKVLVYQDKQQIGWMNLKSHYYQAWAFEPAPTGCHVTTEEIGLGESAAHAAIAGDTRTHRAHDLWLASLRWISLGGTDLR